MRRLFTPSVAKVFSGLFIDLSAAWIVSLFGTHDPWLFDRQYSWCHNVFGGRNSIRRILKNMIDLTQTITTAQIAFALMMIAASLVFIAFKLFPRG